MKISGAIFDMDGTLADSLMYWDMFWARVGETYRGDPGFRPDPETEKSIRTMALRDAMALLHDRYGIAESGDALWEMSDRLCARFYAEDVQMKPGAMEFLDHCLDRGIRMCVASATASDLLDILVKKYRLDRYFPRIFSCSEIGRGKEHPDIFLLANEWLGTPKESTWIFEDSIIALETASAAGYQTVGIYDQYNASFPREQVAALSTVYIGEGDSLARLIPEI